MKLALSGSVLLVEDTPSLSMVYQSTLERAGLTVHPVFGAREALDNFEKKASRLVLLDLMLPDGNGLDVLREIHGRSPDSKILVITANGSINRAVEAMRRGAFDFLIKPFDDRRLLGAVQSAIRSLEMDVDEPRGSQTDSEVAQASGFVGSSACMHQICAMIRKIGRSTATVFIMGESGTGKEIAARAIHHQSIRRNGPFIAINCGAIPRDLLESEVFGHLKGSFTGAIADKPGAAAAADGGTLFLDEICEMDMALQTKLLRFLQSSTIQPVGAVQPRNVDVRIVCATNRDPVAEVAAGRFREDLFYRLHVVPVLMPPLRERGDDVLEIAGVLLERFAHEEGKSFKRLSGPVRDVLRGYSWPGNIRQLENVIRNAIVLNEGEELTLDMLPPSIWQPYRGAEGHRLQPGGAIRPAPPADAQSAPSSALGRIGENAASGAAPNSAKVLRSLVGETLADFERKFIEATIEICDGSVPRASRMLDVSPSTIYRKREAWERSAPEPGNRLGVDSCRHASRGSGA